MATSGVIMTKEEGIIHFVVEHPAIILVVLGVIISVGVWYFLESRRKVEALEGELELEKKEKQETEIEVLKNLIQQQSTTMSDAVVSIKGITDELRTQISGMGDQMRQEMNQCHADITKRLDTAHKRITEQGEELNKLKGEHERNMEMGSCFFHALRDHNNQDEIIQYFRNRLTAGRRLSDKHPLFNSKLEELVEEKIDEKKEEEWG